MSSNGGGSDEGREGFIADLRRSKSEEHTLTSHSESVSVLWVVTVARQALDAAVDTPDEVQIDVRKVVGEPCLVV